MKLLWGCVLAYERPINGSTRSSDILVETNLDSMSDVTPLPILALHGAYAGSA